VVKKHASYSSLAVLVAALDSQIAAFDIATLLTPCSTHISILDLTSSACLWQLQLVSQPLNRGGHILGGKMVKKLTMPMNENPTVKKGDFLIFFITFKNLN
jgi:hypothetical protein